MESSKQSTSDDNRGRFRTERNKKLCDKDNNATMVTVTMTIKKDNGTDFNDDDDQHFD